MRRRGRSTSSNREPVRIVSRQPDYRSPGSFQTLPGRAPTYRHPSGKTPSTIDMKDGYE